MAEKRAYGGLDVGKIAAALLVVAIHTGPLAAFSPEADFFFTRVLARLAVPFFFLVTGQFVLAPYLQTGSLTPVLRYGKKILLYYGAAVLLYLPVGLYAGLYREVTPLHLVRWLLFDGPFYHLWYFPALLTGLLLLCLLGRHLPFPALAAISAALYLLGLLGDSYWGLTAQVPGLRALYDGGFRLFSYTRNGLFFAPLFLLLGARFSLSTPNIRRKRAFLWFLLSFGVMTTEAFLLRRFDLQRHDSMYLALPFCMVFLYPLFLGTSLPAQKTLRTMSTWVYILHPGVIVAVRGAAKLLHATELLVENSLVHYLAVCAISLFLAWAIAAAPRLRSPAPSSTGRAWAELSRSALLQNIAALRAHLPPDTALMPAVKANAYGHGALEVARLCNMAGIRAFCVACAAEGAALRKEGIRGEILVLGYTHPWDFPLLRRFRLSQTVLDASYAEQLDTYGKPLHVHVAVDTGMHRLGEPANQVDALERIFRLPHLQVEGLFTHLCAAGAVDEKSRGYTQEQISAFAQVTEALRQRGIVCPKVHLLASAGAMTCPQAAGDFARVGIALYGLHSSREEAQCAPVSLHPVLSVKARVAAVKSLVPGESAGYDLAFTASRPTRLAVLSIGYADGLPRALSCGNGAALLHGQRAPILGKICMDQTLVDVTDIPETAPGDIAVLLGRDGEAEISAYDLAETAGTITNEIVSRLGSRLCRKVV